LTSWLIFDIIAVIPFDSIFDSGSVNKLIRFTRIGKVYKLVRLTKLVRLIKVLKVKNNLFKSLIETLKIGAGFERMTVLTITFFILQHVVACLW
jgi:hypothetical protein